MLYPTCVVGSVIVPETRSLEAPEVGVTLDSPGTQHSPEVLKSRAPLGAPGWLTRLSTRVSASAQATISRFVGLSLVLGSVLTVEPAWDSLSPSVSAPPPQKGRKPSHWRLKGSERLQLEGGFRVLLPATGTRACVLWTLRLPARGTQHGARAS